MLACCTFWMRKGTSVQSTSMNYVCSNLCIYLGCHESDVAHHVFILVEEKRGKWDQRGKLLHNKKDEVSCIHTV